MQLNRLPKRNLLHSNVELLSDDCWIAFLCAQGSDSMAIFVNISSDSKEKLLIIMLKYVSIGVMFSILRENRENSVDGKKASSKKMW